MKNNLYALGFFLISLYSFYINGFALITFVGVALIIFTSFIYEDFDVGGDFRGFLFFLYLFLIGAIGSVFFGIDAEYKRVFGFSLVLIFAFFLSFIKYKFDIKYVLYVFLFLHVSLFYIQFILFFFFSIHIDYLALAGLSSRNIGGNFELSITTRFMRSSGLFSEPGTYSCFISPAVALFSRYVSEKKDYLLLYLSLISLILSFSAFGFLFFSMITIFLLRNTIYKLMLGFFVFVFSVPYLNWKFFTRKKGLAEDSVLDFRKEYISAAFENFENFKSFFLGNGIMKGQGYQFIYGGADNDSGLIFYILYNFGGLTFIALLILLFILYFRLNKFSLVTLAILLSSKLSLFSMILPFYIFLALTWDSNKFKNRV